MITRYLLLLFFFITCGYSHSQDAENIKPLRLRAILQDPVNPGKEFYIRGQAGTMVKLNLAIEGLVEAQTTLVAGSSLNLYDQAEVDPKNPAAHLAATAKVPTEASRVIAFIIPAPSGSKPAYRMAFINDEPKLFPWGESRVVNLTPVDFAIEAGEHKIKVDGGKVTALPEVKKINEYNQAQTNFYYKDGENWSLAAEKQLMFLNTIRRIFLIYKSPSALGPDIRTVMDHIPASVPKVP